MQNIIQIKVFANDIKLVWVSGYVRLQFKWLRANMIIRLREIRSKNLRKIVSTFIETYVNK